MDYTKIEVEVTEEGAQSFEAMWRSNESTFKFLQSTALIKAYVSKDKKHFTVEGSIIDSPRTIYFMGGVLDIETGYMLSSYNKEPGFAMLNIYDFFFLRDPDFDKDSFLYQLEDLKLNYIGTETDFEMIVDHLLYKDPKSKNLSDNSSITKKALAQLDPKYKNKDKKPVNIKQISKELFLHVSAYLSLRKYFNDFLNRFLNSSENIKELYPQKYQSDARFKILQDDYNYIAGIRSNLYNFTSYYPFYNCVSYSYLEHFSMLSVEEQEEYELPTEYTKFLENESEWIYDKSYVYTDDESKPKIGKAEKLFNNLKDLMSAAKSSDEEVELYNTLTEDYDVAKKQIKKTSFKEIIKGSYLTNVLKNVKNFLKKDKDSDVSGLDNSITPGRLVSNISKANTHLITLIFQNHLCY